MNFTYNYYNEKHELIFAERAVVPNDYIQEISTIILMNGYIIKHPCINPMTIQEVAELHGFNSNKPETIVIKIRDIKCECGSEKSGSNGHSSWCPKHN